MEHLKLKKYYILELIIMTIFTIIIECINQFYYAGVFKNFVLLINVIFICILIRGLLICYYNIRVIKLNIVVLVIMILSVFVTLPEYTYKEANEIILEAIKAERLNITIDNDTEYRSIIGKYTPSPFVSKWYAIRALENKEEKYYYFNPESGKFFKGEKRKNSNSGITNMPENIK